MSLLELVPALSTAFLAGLLGAGHCFGMCGGIAGGLGAMAGRGGGVGAALTFNLARILSYGLLGGVAALVVGLGGEALSVPAWGRALRVVTAILIALIGLQYLFNLRLLAVVERGGARLWNKVSPWVRRAASANGAPGRLALGLAWGLLPCGLVYSILLTAASTGEFARGFLVMLAFGAGTLPVLMGLTGWAPALAALLGDKVFRRAIGVALILLAVWSVMMMGDASGHSHHQGLGAA